MLSEDLLVFYLFIFVCLDPLLDSLWCWLYHTKTPRCSEEVLTFDWSFDNWVMRVVCCAATTTTHVLRKWIRQLITECFVFLCDLLLCRNTPPRVSHDIQWWWWFKKKKKNHGVYLQVAQVLLVIKFSGSIYKNSV